MTGLLYRNFHLSNNTVADILVLGLGYDNRTICFAPNTLDEIDIDLSDDDLDFLLEDIDLCQRIPICYV